jgi:hypothetical protein
MRASKVVVQQNALEDEWDEDAPIPLDSRDFRFWKKYRWTFETGNPANPSIGGLTFRAANAPSMHVMLCSWRATRRCSGACSRIKMQDGV